MISVAFLEYTTNYRNVWEVLLNSSAEAALPELPKLQPIVAVIDVHLPGMSGIERIKGLRELTQDTLFMICTAYDEEEEVFQALQAGAPV